MSDPFESSRRKIAWAKKNIENLHLSIKAFIEQESLYTTFTEPDTKNPQHTVHKMRMVKQMPDGLSELTGNIVDDLRAALDHALYGIALIHNPATELGAASFPFSSDAAHFDNALKGRCKGILVKLWPLLRSFQPYKGGSEPLFALNAVCGANKHGIILPVGSCTVTTETAIEGAGFWSMPSRPIWDWAKQEMELFTAGPQPKFRAHVKIAVYIAFGEVGGLAGKAAIPTLDLFANMVETIINEIESESRRLGVI